MELIFEFLLTFRRHAKAFKQVAKATAVLDNVESALDATEKVLDTVETAGKELFGYDLEQFREIVRNAMAYAWEVGSGAPLTEMVYTSPDNPFMYQGWFNGVLPGSE